jgi:Na+-transporting NADH:ubiquinone oxidoreductase subunit NqrB
MNPAVSEPRGAKRPLRVVAPTLADPRVTLAGALTLWTVLGQTFLYFDRDPAQILAAVVAACAADMLLSFAFRREILVPISAYITAMSVAILLESYDWRVFAVASLWGVASKHLLRAGDRHFFNPSNFSIVTALLLLHGIATVAPGSQWGGDFRVAVLILVLGLMLMRRVNRLDLVAAWLGGYVAMSLLRVLLGQGGLVFALGPMTGAEFALFSFSMLPDPKASPPTRNGRIAWGLMIAVLDGVMRLFEIRYSMFYALFAFCAALPVFRMVAGAAGIAEADPWRTAVRVLRGGRNLPAD